MIEKFTLATKINLKHIPHAYIPRPFVRSNVLLELCSLISPFFFSNNDLQE